MRVARGRRVAEIATNRFDEASLVAAIAQAARMAPQIPEDPAFSGFAGASAETPPAIARLRPGDGRVDPEERADLLAPLLESVRMRASSPTGVLDATAGVEALATTHGLTRCHAGTIASFKIWALESGGAGGAAGHGHDARSRLDRLDLTGETERAIRDAQRSKNPDSIPAGEYDAVLEPRGRRADRVVELHRFRRARVSPGFEPLVRTSGGAHLGRCIDVAEDPLGDIFVRCALRS